MRVRSNRIESAPPLMIIPMIDVIFFLLVFFMFSTLHTTARESLPVRLPQAQAAQRQSERALNVTLQADGSALIEDRSVRVEKIAEAVRPLVRDREDLPVILRADRAAEHGRVVAVMDELKIAGVKKLSIAAQNGGARS